MLVSKCQLHFSVSLGSRPLVELIKKESPFTLFCHHAADTKNYRSSSFDCAEAVASNAKGAREILQRLQQKGCGELLLTGSFFESNEGGNLKAFTPYGLSKSLSYEIFLFHAENLQIKLGKFVIPNPFGPYEEDRFTTHLAFSWKKKITPLVKTPGYIRDNIPVFLLSSAYADFAESLTPSPGLEIFRPSGYVESQSHFTQRFANEIGARLKLDCPFAIAENPLYTEPMQLKNSDNVLKNWDEKNFWDRLAEFYEEQGLRP